MKVQPTEFQGLFVIEPAVLRDARGHFMETWRNSRYSAAGKFKPFLQDNVSWSRRGVLRGMHFQNPDPQDKLIYVLQGEIFDAVVDIRRGSATFGKWFGCTLSDTNARQLYVPGGFAHGFCVLSDSALVSYKCSAEYRPEAEMSLAWNDPQVGIDWPVTDPFLSAKDQQAPQLAAIASERLPAYDLAD